MCELRISRDVVFDEMSSWYYDVQDTIEDDVKNDVVVQNVKPQS